MKRGDAPGLLPRFVFDASSLIQIERNKRMHVLAQRHGDVLIPKKVAVEVSVLRGKPLRRFVRSYRHVVTELKPDEEIEYLRILRQSGMDPGESEVIAVAVHRQLAVVIEEKRGRRKAQEHNLRCHSWMEFVEGKC